MVVFAGILRLALGLLRLCLGALLASILVLQADTSTRGWIARAHPGPNLEDICSGCFKCMLVQQLSSVSRDVYDKPAHCCRRTHQAG